MSSVLGRLRLVHREVGGHGRAPAVARRLARELLAGHAQVERRRGLDDPRELRQRRREVARCSSAGRSSALPSGRPAAASRSRTHSQPARTPSPGTNDRVEALRQALARSRTCPSTPPTSPRAAPRRPPRWCRSARGRARSAAARARGRARPRPRPPGARGRSPGRPRCRTSTGLDAAQRFGQPAAAHERPDPWCSGSGCATKSGAPRRHSRRRAAPAPAARRRAAPRRCPCPSR